MKRMITAAILTAVMSVSTQAVAEGDRAARAQQQMEQTFAQLELTDEQIEQVKPVLQESMAAQQRIMSSYGIDPASGAGSAGKLRPRQAMSMRKELEAVRADTLGKLAQILSAEQLDEYQRIQEQRRAEMQERMREAR